MIPNNPATPAGSVPFSTYTAELAAKARAVDGVRGVVLLGSSSDAGAARRDEWSDHDFYVVLSPGLEQKLRSELPFLPMQDRVVLIAREGGDGGAALYDDGHLLEFGAGTTAEFPSAKFDRHQLLFGDPEVTEWAAEAVQRAAEFGPESAVDAAGLTLVKLLIGYGRATRGELISASAFVRGHAVTYLTLAIRQRIAPVSHGADAFDPLRRFEVDYPKIATRIVAALDAPVLDAARQLLTLLRGELEPGWAEFPTEAADIVSSRLG